MGLKAFLYDGMSHSKGQGSIGIRAGTEMNIHMAGERSNRRTYRDDRRPLSLASSNILAMLVFEWNGIPTLD